MRTAGEQTLLWRSDRAEPGRVLREGIEAPARLLDGGVLRTTGEGLLALIRAWDGRGRFEWASLRGLPAGEIPEEVLGAIPADLARMKISIPEEFLFFVSKGEDARVLFSRREHLRCATAALLRGFVHNLSPAPTSRPGDHVCDQLARLSDARGLTARPGRDFTDKGRTLEVKARLGGTPWSPPPPPGRMSSPEDEEVLIYYDRTSGFWAVVH